MASLIGLFAPGTALASHASASISGPNQAWHPGNKSADEIIKTDHKLMWGWARSLIRDSIHVSGTIRKICNNVVLRGIKPQAGLTLPDAACQKSRMTMPKMSESTGQTRSGSLIATADAEKIGIGKSQVRDLMKEETWYTPEEAVDAGLANNITGGSGG
jgi:hypothetical protein